MWLRHSFAISIIKLYPKFELLSFSSAKHIAYCSKTVQPFLYGITSIRGYTCSLSPVSVCDVPRHGFHPKCSKMATSSNLTVTRQWKLNIDPLWSFACNKNMKRNNFLWLGCTFSSTESHSLLLFNTVITMSG